MADDRGWKEAFKYRLCKAMNRDLKKIKPKSADFQNYETNKGRTANKLKII